MDAPGVRLSVRQVVMTHTHTSEAIHMNKFSTDRRTIHSTGTGTGTGTPNTGMRSLSLSLTPRPTCSGPEVRMPRGRFRSVWF